MQKYGQRHSILYSFLCQVDRISPPIFPFLQLQNLWMSPLLLHPVTGCGFKPFAHVLMHMQNSTSPQYDVIFVAGNILLCCRQWLIARLYWLENRATVIYQGFQEDKLLCCSNCVWLTVTHCAGTYRLAHSSLNMQKAPHSNQECTKLGNALVIMSVWRTESEIPFWRRCAPSQCVHFRGLMSVMRCMQSTNLSMCPCVF